MSETVSIAETNEHDVAVAEAQSDAIIAAAEADAAARVAETAAAAEAAESIAETQAESAEEWRVQVDTLTRSLNALQSDQQECRQMISGIETQIGSLTARVEELTPPPPPQEPENPENPETAPAAETPAEEAAEEAAQAEEPKPAERKRAHRWI
jgi:DNA anti-recombination protein RmuC